jgi:hypothetical protein
MGSRRVRRAACSLLLLLEKKINSIKIKVKEGQNDVR